MSHSQQSLGRWQGVGLLVTTMLGTGVFVLPQLTVQAAGSLALWVWALLTLAMLPLVQVFAALSVRFPSAGGPAEFVQQAFGWRQGMATGLLFVCLLPVGAPAALEITLEFVDLIAPLDRNGRLLLVLTMLAGIVLLNWRGVRTSGVLQTSLTLTMLAIVLALLLVHQGELRSTVVLPQAPALAQIGQVFALAMWSFLGVEALTHLVPEFADSERDFPWVLTVGTLVVGLIYLACTALVLLQPDAPGLVLAQLLEQLWPGVGRQLLAVLGCFSGLATVNVYLASAARLMANLASQQALPGMLQHSNRYGVPGRALLVLVVVIALVMTGVSLTGWHYAVLIEWTNGVFVLIYLFSLLAGWVLLPAQRARVLPAMGVCLALMLALGWNMLYGLALWGLIQLLLARRQPTASDKSSRLSR